jgi:CheY-like chemotaxis protein
VWRDKAVLVVEDDDAIAEMLRGAFARELGANTVVARDGVEALAWIARIRPALVVMDVALPRLDGVEVARRVKADPVTRATRIVAISALTPSARVRRRSLEAGCDDFMAKPLDLDALLTLVHRRLAEADTSADPPSVPPGDWPSPPG